MADICWVPTCVKGGRIVYCHFRILQGLRCREFHKVQPVLKTCFCPWFHMVQMPLPSIWPCRRREYPPQVDCCRVCLDCLQHSCMCLDAFVHCWAPTVWFWLTCVIDPVKKHLLASASWIQNVFVVNFFVDSFYCQCSFSWSGSPEWP